MVTKNSVTASVVSFRVLRNQMRMRKIQMPMLPSGRHVAIFLGPLNDLLEDACETAGYNVEVLPHRAICALAGAILATQRQLDVSHEPVVNISAQRCTVLKGVREGSRASRVKYNRRLTCLWMCRCV